MRSSTILTLLGASLAVASPINVLQKKAIVWDVVTTVEYVTVTEGDLPTTSSEEPATTVLVMNTVYVDPVVATPTTTSVVVPTTTSTPPPPPPPAPTTTSTPPPPPSPVVVEVAPPTTTAAPAPVVVEAAPVVVEAAPVVAAVVSTPEPAPVAASPIVAAAAASPTDFISSGLFYHNQHRKNHGVGALTWDAGLASSAQVLADRCVFAHDVTIGGGGYGQNIDTAGLIPGGDPTSVISQVKAWDPAVVLGNSISNNWYKAEATKYDVNYDGYDQDNPVETSAGGQFLHFTQIVWKDTTKVGCGVTYCGANTVLGSAYAWYTVCNYASAGNYAGEFKSEVLRPTGTIQVDAPVPEGL